MVEVQNAFRKEAMGYAEGMEKAREKIEDTNILVIKEFRHANIVGKDAETDGIFRFDRRNGRGKDDARKGFPKDVVRLHMFKERGRNSDELWDYLKNKGKRRCCTGTAKELKHWVGCLLGSDEKQGDTLLKYTEQHAKILTEVVRMIHRR